MKATQSTARRSCSSSARSLHATRPAAGDVSNSQADHPDRAGRSKAVDTGHDHAWLRELRWISFSSSLAAVGLLAHGLSEVEIALAEAGMLAAEVRGAAVGRLTVRST